MKKLLVILTLLVLTGCTAGDPAYTNVTNSVPIQGQTSSGDYVTPMIDSATNVLPVMQHEHLELHKGKLFTAYKTLDLGNGATVNMLVVTPNTTQWAHLNILVNTELEAQYDFYEGATVSDKGTLLIAQNRNRNSSNAATTHAYYDPTVTASGTEIAEKHWGSGRSTGGEDSSFTEWLLRQNTTYLLAITNSTANNNHVSIELHWYELTNEE